MYLRIRAIQATVNIYIMLYCIYTDCTSGFWLVRSLKKKACLYSLLNRQEKKPTYKKKKNHTEINHTMKNNGVGEERKGRVVQRSASCS